MHTALLQLYISCISSIGRFTINATPKLLKSLSACGLLNSRRPLEGVWPIPPMGTSSHLYPMYPSPSPHPPADPFLPSAFHCPHSPQRRSCRVVLNGAEALHRSLGHSISEADIGCEGSTIGGSIRRSAYSKCMHAKPLSASAQYGYRCPCIFPLSHI